MRRKDPQTAAEWREAIAVAHACLVLDAAHQYGLVTGGPVVNAARADALIRRGRALGYEATEDEINAAIDGLIAELKSEGSTPCPQRIVS